MPIFLRLPLFCALAGISGLPAQSTVTLAPVEVTARRDASLTNPQLETARAELALTPGGIETLSAERYLRGRASTLEDTFVLSPGVIAQSRFGSDEARLSIRGSGLQRTFHGRGIRVLQDGAPVNLADGSFDMQAIEPLAATYVNVWRGGNAPGVGTLGGSIDYISRTGRDTPGGFTRFEFGSHDYLRASVASGAVRGAFDAFASFTHQGQDGFRRHARQNNHRLFANLGWRHSAQTETRFFVSAVRTDSELPGNLTWTQLRSDPRQAAPGNVALHQKRDFDLLRVAAHTTALRGAFTWDFSAAYTFKDLDHPIFQVIDQRTHDALLAATATYSGMLAGRAQRLRAGLNFTAGTIDAANFTNLHGTRGSLVSAADQTATNLAWFIEDQLALGRGFTAVVGLAGGTHRRRNEQRVGGTPSYDLRFHRILPKLGARWDGRDLQVFAHVSSSFEPPSFSETLTLNSPRAAQKAVSVEIGSRGRRGPVRWDLTAYHATLRGELLALDHDNDPSTSAATINADRTIHAGLEAGFDVDLLGTPWDATSAPEHRLVLRAAWTYGRFRFDDDPLYESNRLAGLPPHLIRGELQWESATGWYAGPWFEWAPERTWIDFRNTFAADPHFISCFRAGRRTARGLSWFAEMRNLTDRRYAATTGVIENALGQDQAQFLPGNGRSLYAGLEYRW